MVHTFIWKALSPWKSTHNIFFIPKCLSVSVFDTIRGIISTSFPPRPPAPVLLKRKQAYFNVLEMLMKMRVT